MADQKSMLCVGGPRAGRRYAVLHGSGFRVPIKSDVPENDPRSPEWQPNKPVKVEFADYREETFHTPQGDVSFWVPEGQTPLETIKALLETYEGSFTDWRDIETAPKNGTRIQARRVLDGEIVFEGPAVWRSVRFPALNDPISRKQFAEEHEAEGWMDPDQDKRVPTPTHWKAGR
ncbi:MAG: hypothetical protein ACRED5_07775 [Propylenella sp.]